MPRFDHPPGLSKFLLHARSIGFLVAPVGQHINCEDLVSHNKDEVSNQVYVSATLHQGRNPWYPFDRTVGPLIQLGCCGEDKSLMHSLGIKSQFLGHHSCCFPWIELNNFQICFDVRVRLGVSAALFVLLLIMLLHIHAAVWMSHSCDDLFHLCYHLFLSKWRMLINSEKIISLEKQFSVIVLPDISWR
jgi:hypothetical protein